MMTNFDYSVRVKNGTDWRQSSRIRLMISVGQPYHEGAKLKAVVDWINRNPGIKEVHVSVNDLLQRHNYLADGIPEQQASGLALAEGTLWIERNEEILGAINANTQITRWEDWYNHPGFPQIQKGLREYEGADILFENALDADVNKLVERKLKRGENLSNIDKWIAHSRDYLIEELAVFALQCQELPASEVYPGSNLASAQYFVGKALPEILRPLAKRSFTRIDFARINAVNDVVSFPQQLGVASNG
jgi:tRNA-dependent cyclodipeptide synthase